MIAADSLYKGFRFPEEIISHAVWLYYRFLLSLRDVRELLLERGIVVLHETIRAWCERFGPAQDAAAGGCRPRRADRTAGPGRVGRGVEAAGGAAGRGHHRKTNGGAAIRAPRPVLGRAARHPPRGQGCRR